MTTYRFGLAQMLCEKGDLADNLAQMARLVAVAQARHVDILAFPEMNLTGYIDPAKQPEAVLALDSPEIGAAIALTAGSELTPLAGFVEANPTGKPFITQLVARNGALQGVYRKLTIMDEEAEWFAPGCDVPAFRHGALDFGIAICADIDNRQVFETHARQGAQVVFEVAAPGLYGEQATRDWQSGYSWWEDKCRDQLGGLAQELGLWIAVATQAGRTVDEDFPGGGYVFAPGGNRLIATEDWRPGVLFVALDLESGTAMQV